MMTVNLHSENHDGVYKAIVHRFETFASLKIENGSSEEVTFFFRLEDAPKVDAIAFAINAIRKPLLEEAA